MRVCAYVCTYVYVCEHVHMNPWEKWPHAGSGAVPNMHLCAHCNLSQGTLLSKGRDSSHGAGPQLISTFTPFVLEHFQVWK